jgi:hypothetical protein
MGKEMFGKHEVATAEQKVEEKPSYATMECDGYRVEARHTGSAPTEIAGVLLDTRWTFFPFQKAHRGFGVPVAREYIAADLAMCECYSYQCAQALRWWLHAEAEAAIRGGFCLETRLVKYRIKASREWLRVSEHLVIGGEDRSALMPDYGPSGDVKCA